MDRACAGSVFFRRVTPIFLFIRARDLWRNGGHMGHVFLQLRAAQCFRRTFVHAGCSFAESGTDWSIFFSALDRQRKIDIAICSRNGDLACAANQTSERHRRRAAPLFRLAKMALEFCEATAALAFRHDYNFAFNCVVLARSPNCREILSASFLRRRRNSDRKFLVVLGHSASDSNIEPHTNPRDNRVHRFVRRTTREICMALSLVARGDGSLHHHSWLRQPPSMVSASSRADRCRVCGKGLCVYRIENFLFARCDHDIVDLACEFVCNSRLPVYATALRIVSCSTSRCRSGTAKNDDARFIDYCGRYWRSDNILLCGAQGLALSRGRWDLQRQSGR